MRHLHTDKAPKAIGPYSQSVAVNGLLFTSGQIPLCPESGEIIGDDIKTQTAQAMENLKAIIENEGCHMDDVVKTTCFLANMSDFADFNEVYGTFFNKFPARSCIAVKDLPKAVLVEVEAIVKLNESLILHV